MLILMSFVIYGADRLDAWRSDRFDAVRGSAHERSGRPRGLQEAVYGPRSTAGRSIFRLGGWRALLAISAISRLFFFSQPVLADYPTAPRPTRCC